jgi:serine/threonine protein kinase
MAGLSSLPSVGRIGRYDVLGRLAEGGMAEIFLARAPGAAGVARTVVVKRMMARARESSDATGAFVTEARLLARLTHPALVSIEEFGEHEGAHFLVMEWVRGVSLRRLMDATRTRGGIPWPIVARMFTSLAGGLHHAHEAKDERGRPMRIVHRDVTPENVIVRFSGSPTLLDFGIAKSTIDPQKTQAGVLKGKLSYISPEQYQGRDLDARSDVFALSVCLYEALTGESLYQRANEFETVAAIVLDPSVPSVRDLRKDVPEALDRIVQAGLAKDRDERTKSADAIGEALEKLLVEHGERIRDADVAAFVASVFPGEVDRDPKLERVNLGAGLGNAARKRSKSAEMEAMIMGAEADLDSEAFSADASGKRRSTVLVLLLLLALAGSFLAWAVLRRPPQTPVPTPAAAP